MCWNPFCLFRLLVSMAPLSREIRPITSMEPPHLGPAIPEVNSAWFKLFLYQKTGYGPPTLLLAKGDVWLHASCDTKTKVLRLLLFFTNRLIDNRSIQSTLFEMKTISIVTPSIAFTIKAQYGSQSKCDYEYSMIVAGTRLKRMPAMFRYFDKVLVTTWGHDPGVLPVANIVVTLNDALCHSSVLVQVCHLCKCN